MDIRCFFLSMLKKYDGVSFFFFFPCQYGILMLLGECMKWHFWLSFLYVNQVENKRGLIQLMNHICFQNVVSLFKCLGHDMVCHPI
jgi:hypothetical protein